MVQMISKSWDMFRAYFLGAQGGDFEDVREREATCTGTATGLLASFCFYVCLR